MKGFRLGLAMAAGALWAGSQAWGINISEDWRWKSSSLGTAPVRGVPIRVGWSIPADGTGIAGGGASNMNGVLSGKFGADYMNMFRFMFGRLSAVSGLEFVETPDDGSIADASKPGLAGVRGDVRIVGRDLGGPYGWSNMPSPNQTCVIQINTVVGAGWNYYDWINVTMHEIGHASGLAHQRVYTSPSATDPDLNGTLMGICNSDGPQFDDVYALNRLYGDKLERNGGNNARTSATNLGSIGAGPKSLGTQAGTLRLGSTASDFVSIDGGTDVDYFRLHLDSQSQLAVTVAPKGPTYDYAQEGGARVTFNASSQNDLWFDLLDLNGQALAHVDAAGLGSAENLAATLYGGDYYLRIAGKQDSTQMYELDVSAVAVPEPATLGVLGLGVLGLGMMGLAGRRGLRRGRPS